MEPFTRLNHIGPVATESELDLARDVRPITRAWPAESHDFILRVGWKADIDKGAKPIVAESRGKMAAVVLLGRGGSSSGTEHLLRSGDKWAFCNTTRLPHGLPEPLEAIDMRDVRSHNVPLVDHHAARKDAEETCLDDEPDEAEDEGGIVEAVAMCPPGDIGTAQANKEPCRHKSHGIGAGQEGVEDKEEEILMVANSYAVIHPWTYQREQAPDMDESREGSGACGERKVRIKIIMW